MKETQYEVEKICGLELYGTSSEGGGGRLKKKPEDFKVTELSSLKKAEDGKSIVFDLEKRGRELNEVIKDLSNALGISRKRIGFAGMKDKNAVTKQKVSVWNVSIKELKKISIKNVELSNFRKGKRIERGDLLGNNFEINIREGKISNFLKVHEEVKEKGGVPNFFGIQRFGAKRPITHKVGEKILRGEWEEALKIYLIDSYPNESIDALNAREKLKNNWGDFGKALNYFPARLSFERSLLNALAEGKKPLNAFENLPENLLKLFIHAYQAFLFNKVVCERMKQNISLKGPCKGDVVCFKDIYKGIPDRYTLEKITENNRGKLQKMIEEGEAYITGPLFGEGKLHAGGRPGEIEKKILNEAEIDFQVKQKPSLSPNSLRREIFLRSIPVLQGSTFKFFLPKGCYATTVLREYMKTGPIDMV